MELPKKERDEGSITSTRLLCVTILKKILIMRMNTREQFSQENKIPILFIFPFFSDKHSDYRLLICI